MSAPQQCPECGEQNMPTHDNDESCEYQCRNCYAIWGTQQPTDAHPVRLTYHHSSAEVKALMGYK